jgi:hypothetical protein
MTDSKYAAFKALDPFFNIVQQGLAGLVCDAAGPAYDYDVPYVISLMASLFASPPPTPATMPPPAPADDNADKIARLDQHRPGMPTTDIPRVAARNVRNRSVNKRSSNILFGGGP